MHICNSYLHIVIKSCNISGIKSLKFSLWYFLDFVGGSLMILVLALGFGDVADDCAVDAPGLFW